MTDRSQPTWHVTAQREGKSEERLDIRQLILSLEYQDEEDKSDMLKLTVRNEQLKNFDNPLFAPGTKLWASWGYVGNMSAVHQAVVTKVGGGEQLQIEAQGDEAGLNKLVRQRTFKNMSRAQAAIEIAQEHGYPEARQYIESIDESEDTIVQSGETDLQFLRRLADTEGFEFFVDIDGFHFHQRKLGQVPIKELRWYGPPRAGKVGGVGDIKSFGVDADSFGTPKQRPGKVTVKGRNPATKKSFTVTASDSDTERDVLAPMPFVPDASMGEQISMESVAKDEVRRTTLTSERAAKREADGVYRKQMLTSVKLTMTLVGDPSLYAKSVLRISGIGKRLSGLYYATSCRHVLSSSGYTTELKLASDGAEVYAADQAAYLSARANIKRASKGKQNKQPTIDDIENEVNKPFWER